MTSALFELLLFSLPSLLWTRRLRRSGRSALQALNAVGLRPAGPNQLGLAIALALPGTALGALLLGAIPPQLLHGGSKNVVGAPTSLSGYLAFLLLALAEEMLFRGFLAGWLFKRYGFRTGNVLQALIFLAPHTLLLLVRVAFWPILPLQLIAGWALGWLRDHSGSIAPCWLAHALTNLLPALLFGL